MQNEPKEHTEPRSDFIVCPTSTYTTYFWAYVLMTHSSIFQLFKCQCNVVSQTTMAKESNVGIMNVKQTCISNYTKNYCTYFQPSKNKLW